MKLREIAYSDLIDYDLIESFYGSRSTYSVVGNYGDPFFLRCLGNTVLTVIEVTDC